MLDISPLDGIRSPFGRRRGGSGPAPSFSPTSLYSSGSQGTWLDPSELTTMFQDAAGTTAVTTPGQPVGLRLDKSKGLALGAELVGTFVAYANATFATVGGVTTVTCSANGSYGITLGFSGAAGKTYAMTFEVLSNSASRVLYGWTSISSSILINAGTTTGVKSGSVLASANGSGVIAILGATAGETFSIRNISVRELAGNHAVAPTDAARPTYGVEPKGGRRNLLTYSEQFDNVAWLRTSATPTAGVIDPSGGTAATTLTATATNGQAVQSITGSLGTATNYVGSIWVRRRTGTGSVYLFNPNSGGITEIIITGTWQRYSVSGLGAAFNNAFGVRMTTSGDAVDIAFPQFELGSTATAYQRVTTAYDVTESGVATCHYVQYDGSDDGMITNSIDFTATDKVSVFAGVSRSGTTTGILLETDPYDGTQNGSLHIYRANATNFSFMSRGTIEVTTGGVLAAQYSVLTGLGDISGDRATIRVNGVQAAQSTDNQGTGNFGNRPIVFGRRANGSLALNGRDYGIVVVGKLANATEIAATETWLAARTAQVTI